MPTRKIFLYGILLMHIGISLLMGLYFFGAVMVLINVAAFGFDLQPDADTTNNKLPAPAEHMRSDF